MNFTRQHEFQVGDSRLNFQGLKMTIVNYYKNSLIDVQFEDGYVREKAHVSEFKNGTIRNRMIPALYGVGILGDSITKVNRKFTKEYSTWANVLQRCYSEEKQKEFPRYKECTVCDEWLYFPCFENWCHEQSNWIKVMNDPSTFHIDKDIINKNNKVYSPDFCSFVPAYVNVLFIKSNAARGQYPLGVSYRKNNNSYDAKVNNPFTKKMECKYGFDNPIDAFNWYKKRKEELIQQMAQREFDSGNITYKCYEAMLNYQIEITD